MLKFIVPMFLIGFSTSDVAAQDGFRLEREVQGRGGHYKISEGRVLSSEEASEMRRTDRASCHCLAVGGRWVKIPDVQWLNQEGASGFEEACQSYEGRYYRPGITRGYRGEKIGSSEFMLCGLKFY